MKKRILKIRIEVKTLVIALLLGVAGITDGYCVRFSAVCPSGISLYYNITDNVNHYVELTHPNHHEDDGYWEDYELFGNDAIIIPETVEYNGMVHIHIKNSTYGIQNHPSLQRRFKQLVFHRLTACR